RDQLMVANDQRFVEPAIYAVDPSVFEIFSLELLNGSESQALGTGPSIAVSETFAKKYFGRTDVVNETVIFRAEVPLTISGVFKDMPSNSHFVMDVVVNFEWAMNAFDQDLSRWNNNPYYTYLLLQEDIDIEVLEQKLFSIREKYANDPMDEDGQLYTYYLQSLSEVHFSENINGSMGPQANASRLHIFTGIAFAVLLMAGINYVNLATARAMVRMKEIGIRKIMGADRWSLLSQFLIESSLLVFLSLFLALLLAYALLPAFSAFVNRPLSFDFLNPIFWLQILIFGLLIALASGLYPALVMSSFNPLFAINKRGSFKNSGYLRSGLVIVQFGLSAILISCTIVLQKQLSFINTLDTGYTREQVLVLSIVDNRIAEGMPSYMEELEKLPGVEAVASSWSLPTNVTTNTEANWPGIDDAERIPMYMLGITHDFFDVYELELKAGRLFDPEIKTDESAIILNEAAVKSLGWQDPLGREMIKQNGQIGTVIGVVKDFHIQSLRQEIEPLQIVLSPDYPTLAVRISGGLVSTIMAIEDVYESFEPSYPFEYRYFADIYNTEYAEDTKTAKLTMVFSLLAMLIACLGLYGLAAHIATRRIKELGVRKVLGATSLSIARLLFTDFLVLIGVASLIAAPITYFLALRWLEGYAYHFDLNAIPFAMTWLILLAFAGITVGYHTVQAAFCNPVEALRDE
ncbi:MAG: FtsX-like permease family protein, partial [Bacteroidota bacterium]